jgi:cystathionine beta-lyase family protein involved in aluminum resistance
MAPSIVGESLKGAELVAEVMQNRLGLPCNPPPGSHRTDIIQAVQCGTRKKVRVRIRVSVSVRLGLAS